jgi:chemotaxis-related protein WspB
MLFLIFQLGKDRYAVEANRIIEVLPLLAIKPLPLAPKGVAGIFNLRGRPVPAIDLNELTSGEPARERITTRILLMHYSQPDGRNHPIGFIAECVNQTLRKHPNDFVNPGVNFTAASYLGPVVMDELGPIQWLHVQHLLSEPMRELLFSDTRALLSCLQ